MSHVHWLGTSRGKFPSIVETHRASPLYEIFDIEWGWTGNRKIFYIPPIQKGFHMAEMFDSRCALNSDKVFPHILYIHMVLPLDAFSLESVVLPWDRKICYILITYDTISICFLIFLKSDFLLFVYFIFFTEFSLATKCYLVYTRLKNFLSYLSHVLGKKCDIIQRTAIFTKL